MSQELLEQHLLAMTKKDFSPALIEQAEEDALALGYKFVTVEQVRVTARLKARINIFTGVELACGEPTACECVEAALILTWLHKSRGERYYIPRELHHQLMESLGGWINRSKHCSCKQAFHVRNASLVSASDFCDSQGMLVESEFREVFGENLYDAATGRA